MYKSVFLVTAAVLFAGCNGSGETSVQTSPESVVRPSATSQPAIREENKASGVARTITPKLVEKAETSPMALYRKCAACHGSQAEKPALGRSAPIAGWETERIVSAIVGYQDGTYGGAMKTLMQNRVKDLSRAQIEALAAYISHLGAKTH